ncbi:MAG: universal stress protein [Azospirillum sp.]|nr:universal stress protein [Azospirillum sp.]
MSYRTILVPMIGVEAEGAALATALGVAKRFNGHVEAVFAQPDPRESMLMLGDGLSASVIEQILRAAETATAARRKIARRQFDTAVAVAGTAIVEAAVSLDHPSVRWREVVGNPPDAMIRESRVSDLAVIDQAAVALDPGATEILESVLLYGGRPVLLAPAEVPAAVGTSIAIAWDGGAEAARAVAGALPLLRRAETVHVMTAEAYELDLHASDRLADYLAWSGIKATVVPIDAGHESIGAALLHAAGRQGDDLVVMGGYGHSRMREMILGGATRHVLRHAKVPVLLAH